MVKEMLLSGLILLAGAAPAGASLEGFIGEYNPRDAGWIATEIRESSHRHGVDPALLAGVLYVESRFRPGETSGAGAIGLAQLMPETAAEVGVDPWDPRENIDGGAKYLAKMLCMSGGEVRQALAAYNAGPNCTYVPPETEAYVRRVIEAREVIRRNFLQGVPA